MIDKQGYSPDFALFVSTLAHTPPAQFGKVMAMTERINSIQRVGSNEEVPQSTRYALPAPELEAAS